MRYLCAIHIRKQKIVHSFRLAKKKSFCGVSEASQLASPSVKNNRFEKSNQKYRIYALLLPSIFNFCAATLKANPLKANSHIHP